MAIGGAFLGGGVELVPAGSCKLELEAYTDNATVSATFTISGGGNTYTVTSGTDGRASKVVPSGVTYTVSATVTGYTAPPSQTVIAESSSIKYVRFDAQLKKAQGDISILQTDVDKAEGDISTLKTDVDKAEGDISTLKTDVGNAQGDISILQTDVKRAQSTADSKASTDVATQSANGLMSSADKTKLDGVDSALAGKVSKSGDTMTGGLSTRFLNVVSPSLDKNITKPSATTNVVMTFKANDGSQLGGFANFTQASGNRVTYMKTVGIDGTTEKRLDIWHLPDNTAYLTFPSWSVGTNDNSDKILTIKMANSLPSLVHTTGNEVIAGSKLFMANPTIIGSSAESGIGLMRDLSVGDVTSWTRNALIGFFWKDFVYNGWISTTRDASNSSIEIVASNGSGVNSVINIIQPNDGTAGYATAPTTPSNATGTEIVTANWSISKFQRKITYGTGDPPSGGQAGDIYIKI